MLSLQTGLTGLRASQAAMDVSANNIANADNQYYTRRDINFASLPTTNVFGFEIGSGVKVHSIQRAYTGVIADSIASNQSAQGLTKATLGYQTQIESIVSPGAGSLQNRLEEFYEELNALTTEPGNTLRRNLVVEKAQLMTTEIQEISNDFVRLKRSAFEEVRSEIEIVNSGLERIGQLTKSIRSRVSIGVPADELMNERDRLIDEIAQKIDVKITTFPDGQVKITGANNQLQIGEPGIQLTLEGLKDGEFQIGVKGVEGELKVGSGSLAAFQRINNEVIPEYQAQLESMTQELIRNVDNAHAQGVGREGSFRILAGRRTVSATDIPLSNAETQFPIESGKLYVSITDEFGESRLESIDIDVVSDSLEDVANKLTSIDGLNAIADPDTRLLSINSSPGSFFDFTGKLETLPDTTQITGTSAPRISGEYNGDINGEFRFEVISGGEVGVTEDMEIEIRDQNGFKITSIEVGKGYVAGSEIEIVDGVKVSFDSGNLNPGDRFTTEVVATPDESGLLVSLGINSFFEGNSAETIGINRELLENSDRLATSKTGAIGDSTNVINILSTRDLPLDTFGGLTLEENMLDVARRAGTQVKDLQTDATDLQRLRSQLDSERDSFAGVDQNEEFVKVLQYQRSYEMNARVITASNENLDVILGLLG